MKYKKRTLGAFSVAFAYVCWGVLTVFWNLLGEVNSIYILAQRIVWSMVFMGIYMTAAGKWTELQKVLKDRKKLSV